jgi:hypothetical protein
MEARQEQVEHVADEHRDAAEFAIVIELDADALSRIAGGISISKYIDRYGTRFGS